MAFFIVALLKSREPMRVARPLLVIELWPNSLTECLGLQIWCAARFGWPAKMLRDTSVPSRSRRQFTASQKLVY
jgi:hypothetical protein